MMDQVFQELIGKPQLNPAKTILVIAENFTFTDDQSKFLKATLAIPAVKKLPLDNVSKHLINIGPLHQDIKAQVQKEGWEINHYKMIGDDICDKMGEDFGAVNGRSILFINDASRIEILGTSDDKPRRKFLRLVDEWKRIHNHFVIVLYQNSSPNSSGRLLRDLEYLSDAAIRTKSFKTSYFQSAWFQNLPAHKTLIPAKVETSYHTCKIGKSYWSADLLCFYDRRKVVKDFDPDHDTQVVSDDEEDGDQPKDLEKVDHINRLDLASDETDLDSTLPYTRAQNPEQSRIFYYPDKDDDIDEDDPDNDLGF